MSERGSTCRPINPYGSGRRQERRNLSLFALLISAVRDSMNHLLAHPCRCVPLLPGERPATPQCCEHRRLLTCRRPPYKPVCQEAPHVCAAKTLLGTAPFAAPLSRRSWWFLRSIAA